jgi:hypothetical protein
MFAPTKGSISLVWKEVVAFGDYVSKNRNMAMKKILFL